MDGMQTLFYIFRGKLNTETVSQWEVSNRAKVLIGCTRADIYTLTSGKHLLFWHGRYWVNAENAPDEIKMAAMLVN